MTQNIKVLIVDDERLARAELVRLLRKQQYVTDIYEANCADDALKQLSAHDIDIAFLDIAMPEISGLQLAQQLPNHLHFVFCTAFHQHAVDAFDLNALDYIVKPVVEQRLVQTLDRYIDKSRIAPSINAECFLDDNHGLLLKFGENAEIVRLYEIELFESIGNHVAVYCEQGKAFLYASLTKVETRLDPNLFFKANRSEIIRIEHIVRLENAISAGGLVAVMQSGKQIEISRRQAQTLKQRFNLF